MAKQTQQLFDVQAWARASLREAPKLQTATLDVIAGFTFLWNFFEGVACGGNVSAARLGEVAMQISVAPLARESVKHSLSFYRFRYVDESHHMRKRFDGLNFRKNDNRELVEAVLTGAESTLNAQIHALLIIVYRIRNNMFHGLKSVRVWDDQAQNISEAARILSVALEALATHIVRDADATQSDRH